MISNTTITDKEAKSVVLKTTGHEQQTVTSAAKANGDKLKPCIVFPGHKREVLNLKKRSCNQKSLLHRLNHKSLNE